MKTPKAGRLYAVTSQRANSGQSEQVTRIFRQLPAAERHAQHQRQQGRGPVSIWVTIIDQWRPTR